jgi:hypothetical protein
MLKQVIFSDNPLDIETYERYDVENLFDFIIDKLEVWPETARLYNKSVSLENDITPTCEADIERIQTLEGPFFVMVYPGDPITWLYVIVVVVLIASIAASFLLRPSIPNPTQRNTQSASPNNELSDRTNSARPMARIPDIFGTVRSTPDLLAVPYKIFINHEEVEYCYMCIGRGFYEVSDIRDDVTLCSDIAGTSVEVYAPNTSPNSGTPQLTIGTAIETPVLSVARSNSVNGQVLRSPNDQNIKAVDNIWFSASNQIETTAGVFDFTNKFVAGDNLTIARSSIYASYSTTAITIIASSDGSFKFSIPNSTLPTTYFAGQEIKLIGALFNVTDIDGYTINSYDLSETYNVSSVNLITETITPEFEAPYNVYYCRVVLNNPASINPQWSNADGFTFASVGLKIPNGELLFNLDGVYTILSVSALLIILSSPASVNSQWSTITTTPKASPILSTSGSKWVGPFILDTANLSQVFGNFVALNGLYKDDGQTQTRFDVTVEVELTPINIDGSPRGSAETFQGIIEGSATYRSSRAITIKAVPTFTGRCQIRARRVSESNLAFTGQVVDEIKWRDVYAVVSVVEAHFGNLTTVQSVTYATASALSLKERKLNMLVTRKLPARVSGSSFTTEVFATNSGADILSAICLDKYIGNRNIAEVDFDSIYDTVAEINDYFGTSIASEFNYTFDKDNVSFEETVATIASSIFSTAYRRGSLIKLSFEKLTEDSTLLFNHRNKVPGSETRTVTFGNDSDNDGVEYGYVDPADDAIITLYLPEDRSAINPVKIESVGIRNKLQAWFQAWRIWNKLQHQNITIEFEATQEAGILVLKDRILAADNTRPDTQDGEIVEQNGLILTLSQEVDLTKYSAYAIFLQHIDGTVEAINITPGVTKRNVILANPPRLTLALEDDLYARTTFIIVGNSEQAQRPFLVTEKTPHDNFTTVVKAVNYDERYYNNDFDFLNDIIDIDGNKL